MKRHRIIKGDKAISVSHYISGDLDNDKMVSTFASIYTHCGDAWIIHKWLTQLSEVNKACHEKNITPMSSVTNQLLRY